MPEEAKEQLSYQFDSIRFKLEGMLKDLSTLGAKLAYSDGDWPEDADIMLEEADDAVGDALDKWCEIFGQIMQYLH